jgi:DNA-binding NarL/FixJ family response regulator/DNA-binding SARP family transcriptional activator
VTEEVPDGPLAKVLVVDDHPIMREVLASLLRNAGYAVFEASDGEQAIRIASSERPEFVLMDVLMPGMSGIEATARIMLSDQAPRVLMLSAVDSRETIRASVKAGATGYLSKTTTTAMVLIDALRRASTEEWVFVPAELADALAEDREAGPPNWSLLTAREEQIATLVAEGAPNSEVAAALSLSPRTIERHLGQVYRKLDINSRVQLALMVDRQQVSHHVQAAQERGILLAEIPAYATHSIRHQAALQNALYNTLSEAFASSDLPWSASHLQDRGDGVLIVLPPSIPVSKLINPFLMHLGDALERRNRLAPMGENIQLRVALDAGPVIQVPNGFAGTAIVRCARLLDASDFRAASQASGATLGVIVSESAYGASADGGIPGLRPADIRHVNIDAKGMRASARIWFIGNAIPPALRPAAARVVRSARLAEPRKALHAMRFRLLGPLEVWTDGTWQPVGSPKWRSLLACLLLQVGQVVATDTLIKELWGDEPPDTGKNLISIYVLRLRRLLEDADGRLLSYRSPGYMLSVSDGETDIQRFGIMVDEAREELASGDPFRAKTIIEDALGLWRGQLLADVPPSPIVSEGSERISELKLDALELKIAADMQSLGYRQVVPELRRLVAEHPLREGPWLMLMRALAATSGRAEALAAYNEAIKVMSEERGVGPSPALSRAYADLQSGHPIDLGVSQAADHERP